MKKLIVGISAAALSFAACAASFTLKSGVSGAFDWTDASNYEGATSAPGANDDVVIPENVTVNLSPSTPQASLDLINALGRICPSEGAKVVVTVPSGEFSLAVPVNMNSYSSATGCLVKEGAGVLRLTSVGKWTNSGATMHGDYQVGLDVQAGELWLPQATGVAEGKISTTFFQHLGVNVAAGAAIHFAAPGSTSVWGLSGAGDACDHNEGIWKSAGSGYWSYPAYFRIHSNGSALGKTFVFSGKLTGKMSVQNSACQSFIGTDSHAPGGLDVMDYDGTGISGVLGLASFGMASDTNLPSSVKTKNAFLVGYQAIQSGQVRGGKFLYLGSGEVTDRGFNRYMVPSGSSTVGDLEFDAGANGGLFMTGEIAMKDASAATIRNVVLSGSSVGNVFSNKIAAVTDGSGDRSALTVVKRGTGTWRLGSRADTTNGGLVAAEEGTLEFDAVAATGAASSFGTGLDAYPVGATGTRSSLTPATWSVQVGSATTNTVGTLAWAGAGKGIATNRTLGVAGNGRLANDQADELRWRGVVAASTGTNVLTLAGEGASLPPNYLSNVSDRQDGMGDLSIVKDGTRDWVLVGNQSFHGSLRVKSGTLVCRNAYSWYRWTVKSNQGGTGLDLYGYEVGLYDKAGRDLAPALTPKASELSNYSVAVGDWWNASAGTMQLGVAVATMRLGVSYAALFDNKTSTYLKMFWYVNGVSGGVLHNDPTDEKTWLPFVMRFAADEEPVCSYDVAVANSGAYIGRWTLEGSVDGVEWDELHDQADQVSPTPNGWVYAKRAGTDDEETHTDGQSVLSAPTGANFLANCSSVQVDRGATLKIVGEAMIRALTVDPDAVGTADGVIEGGAFAETGTIDLPKSVKAGTVLPLDVSKVGGVANLANWTVNVGGKPTGRKIDVKDGKIILTTAGFAVFLR